MNRKRETTENYRVQGQSTECIERVEFTRIKHKVHTKLTELKKEYRVQRIGQCIKSIEWKQQVQSVKKVNKASYRLENNLQWVHSKRSTYVLQIKLTALIERVQTTKIK